MQYSIQQIANILNAKSAIKSDAFIEHLLIDSRKISFPDKSLFFALSGPRRNGHQFIKEVYDQGVSYALLSGVFCLFLKYIQQALHSKIFLKHCSV